MKKKYLLSVVVAALVLQQLHAKEIDSINKNDNLGMSIDGSMLQKEKQLDRIKTDESDDLEPYDEKNEQIEKLQKSTKILIKSYNQRKKDMEEKKQREESIFRLSAIVDESYSNSIKIYKHINWCLNNWDECVKEYALQDIQNQIATVKELIKKDKKHKRSYRKYLRKLQQLQKQLKGGMR